jgi:hypothetical protein
MEENEIEEIEIRVLLKKKAKYPEDRELFEAFIEMGVHLKPLKTPEITRYLIMRAYEHWFKKEIKKD